MADALGPREVSVRSATQRVVGGVHELPEQGGAIERSPEVGQRRIVLANLARGTENAEARLLHDERRGAGVRTLDEEDDRRDHREPGDAGKHDSEYGEGRYCVVRGDVRWSSMGANIGCIGSLAEATRRGVVVSEVRSILK